MAVLTLANQLTLLRMLLIPAFVILTIYQYLGWALSTFVLAGVTDMLDGVIARWSNKRTNVGAWLDPAADKLLLLPAFIVLTLPTVKLWEAGYGELRRDECRNDEFQLLGADIVGSRCLHLCVARDCFSVRPSLHRARSSSGQQSVRCVDNQIDA